MHMTMTWFWIGLAVWFIVGIFIALVVIGGNRR